MHMVCKLQLGCKSHARVVHDQCQCNTCYAGGKLKPPCRLEFFILVAAAFTSCIILCLCQACPTGGN